MTDLMQDPHRPDEQVVRGEIRRVTFRNPENGYAVLQLDLPDADEPLVVVGICLNPRAGAHVTVRGTYKDHPKFGRQLQAHAIVETTPSSAEGLENYLGSGLIKGIGKQTAKRIIAAAGTENAGEILNDAEKLAKIKGVGRHKAELIAASFSEQTAVRAVIQFLVEHNVSTNLAAKIYQKYQNKSIEILTRDPYVLARDMRGIGFLKADAIALNLGIKPDAPVRLRAGLYYALEKAAEDGHCYLTLEQLVQRTRVLLQCTDDLDLHPQLESLKTEESLIIEDDRIYLAQLYRAECFVADFIRNRTNELPEPCLPATETQTYLEQAAVELGVTFSPEQVQAVHQATNSRFMIITGGPGCGKTTVTRALVTVFQRAGKVVLLAAPTGRAAQRMAGVCNHAASTIHRLLKFDPLRGGFLHGASDPLIGDVIIIDEASMVDIVLARDLLSAIPDHAHLIFVGDKDQLPSVGPGRVFGDLINCREVQTIALSRLFRRAEESNITSVAHMINSGIVPEIPEPDGITKSDAYFIVKREAAEAATMIEKLVGDQIPKKFGIPPAEITVLTPSNRGPLGTIELNRLLQNRLNLLRDPEQELLVGDTVLRLGDRVCQRVNNYQIDSVGVFNGDIGTIFQVNRSQKSLVVELWDGRLVTYSSRELPQLAHAYAITVHRSQGSEISCVVLALHESHFTLLERQLIYTAVTRAKKLLIVVGSRKALHLASKRMTAKRRQTSLHERVNQQFRIPQDF